MILTTLQFLILLNNIHNKVVIKEIKIFKNKCKNLGFKNTNQIRKNMTRKIAKKIKC